MNEPTTEQAFTELRYMGALAELWALIAQRVPVDAPEYRAALLRSIELDHQLTAEGRNRTHRAVAALSLEYCAAVHQLKPDDAADLRAAVRENRDAAERGTPTFRFLEPGEPGPQQCHQGCGCSESAAAQEI
jgi:hypothetical protein